MANLHLPTSDIDHIAFEFTTTLRTKTISHVASFGRSFEHGGVDRLSQTQYVQISTSC